MWRLVDLLQSLFVHNPLVTVLHGRKSVGPYIKQIAITREMEEHANLHAIYGEVVRDSLSGKVVETKNRGTVFCDWSYLPQ